MREVHILEDRREEMFEELLAHPWRGYPVSSKKRDGVY